MDIARRLIGSSAVVSDGEVTDVDVTGLVRRLLLFDAYVLTSVRLREFPILAQRLGYGALRDLLDSKLIEIRCECLQLTQIGQTALFGDPVLPPLSYKFNWIDMHDRPKYIHDCLQDMHESSSLRHKEVLKIKRSIVECIKQLPPEVRPTLFPPFRNELLNNAPLVRKAIELSIKKSRGLTGDVPFSLRVHEETEDTYKVETDLAEQLKIETIEVHKIIEAGLLGLAAMTQAIGEMKAYSAISGFRDEELPLFRDKLDFLADAVSSTSKERAFQRVITIAGLPDMSLGDLSINVEKLLKTRDSSEAREFRDWLPTIGNATDAEIQERVSGLRNTVGRLLGIQSVKDVKTLILSALSSIPHPSISLLATGAGVLDQFLVAKLLPRSGIAAFVNELYPSIFQKRETDKNNVIREFESAKKNSATSAA
jgi:hypothetical protein